MQVAGQFGGGEIGVEEDTFAALLVDEVDEGAVGDGAGVGRGLRIDGVVGPDGGELVVCAEQEMPGIDQFMGAREIEGGGDGVSFGVHAYGEDGDMWGVLAE